MEMTNAEILNSYKEAKDKKAQVKILAELNLTKPEAIVNILREQGVDGRAFQWLHPNNAKDKKKEAVSVMPKPETPRVKPRLVHDFYRMAELFAAIQEDVLAGKEPPAEWVNEFDELWGQSADKLLVGEK